MCFLLGKRAITSYSDQIVEMSGLDANMNLDAEFDMRGKSISFRVVITVKLIEAQDEAMVRHDKWDVD